MPTRRGGEREKGASSGSKFMEGEDRPEGAEKRRIEEEEIKHPLSSLLLLPSQRPADAALVDEDSPTRKLSWIK